MKISEIAPRREKQVKVLKKVDDPLRHKGPKTTNTVSQRMKAKCSDIDIDIKTLSDVDFEKKYGNPKAQMQKDLSESNRPK